MVIPERVRILYKEYKTEQKENLHDGENELYGQINYIEEKITLNSGSSEEQRKATLMHELIHGLDEVYRIGLEEEQVDKLGNAIYMLLKDNPDMFERGDAD